MAISLSAFVGALVIAGWFFRLYGYCNELDRELFAFGAGLSLVVGVASRRISGPPTTVGYTSFRDGQKLALARAQQQPPVLTFLMVGATAALIVVPQWFGEWKTLPALAGAAFTIVAMFAAAGPWWLMRGYDRAVVRWNAVQALPETNTT